MNKAFDNLVLEESFEGGKYTIQIAKNGSMRCLRHGESWRDFTGDKLICAMAHEVESLRNQLKTLKQESSPNENLIAPKMIYLSEGWEKDKGPQEYKNSSEIRQFILEILQNGSCNAQDLIYLVARKGNFNEGDVKNILWSLTAAGEVLFSPGFTSVYLRDNKTDLPKNPKNPKEPKWEVSEDSFIDEDRPY